MRDAAQRHSFLHEFAIGALPDRFLISPDNRKVLDRIVIQPGSSKQRYLILRTKSRLTSENPMREKQEDRLMTLRKVTDEAQVHHQFEKLLYSRRDTAAALSLSIRSIDYLITTGRLSTRRVGGKILIPASAVRRFARGDHPELVRNSAAHLSVLNGKKPPASVRHSNPESAPTGRMQM
jgi:hypothetical protein